MKRFFFLLLSLFLCSCEYRPLIYDSQPLMKGKILLIAPIKTVTGEEAVLLRTSDNKTAIFKPSHGIKELRKNQWVFITVNGLEQQFPLEAQSIVISNTPLVVTQ